MSPEERERTAASLDRAEAFHVRLYRRVLAAVVLAVAGLVAVLVANRPPGFGSQGEWFYLGIALVLFAGWVTAQLAALARRAHRTTGAPLARLETRPAGAHGRTFTFTLGGGAPAPDAAAPPEAGRTEAAWTLAWNATNLPAEDQLDREAVARATALRGAGHDLADVCRAVNPRYATWDAHRQEFYRRYVQALVDAQRT